MMVSLPARLVRRLHVSLIRGRFGAFGNGSIVEPPATLVRPDLVHLGAGVWVREHAWLNAKDDLGDGHPTLKIGDGTYIGRFCQINAWQHVTIGKNVLIADRVFISDADHNYEDVRTPVLLQGDRFKGSVILHDGCWLGIGVVVMPGVTVGRNAVVAANAVITSDVPDYAVAGGVPARILRRLDQASAPTSERQWDH